MWCNNYGLHYTSFSRRLILLVIIDNYNISDKQWCCSFCSRSKTMVFGFFPVHGPLHFITRKFSLYTFFISLKWRKKGKESQFGPAADIDPKVTVCHKIIPVRPIGRKYNYFWLKYKDLWCAISTGTCSFLCETENWLGFFFCGCLFLFVCFVACYFGVFLKIFLFFHGSRLRQGCLCSLFFWWWPFSAVI